MQEQPNLQLELAKNPLSSNKLDLIYSSTQLFRRTIAPASSYFSRGEGAPLLELLKDFESNYRSLQLFKAFQFQGAEKKERLTSTSLLKFIIALPPFFASQPKIKWFYELCLMQIQPNTVPANLSILDVDESFLRSLNDCLNFNSNYNFGLPIHLKFLKNWLNPKNTKLHQFTPLALRVANHCLHAHWQERRTLLSDSNYKMQRAYHDYLEQRLLELRAQAKNQQTHHSLLCEHLIKLEAQLVEQAELQESTYTQIEEVLAEEAESKPTHKKALDKVSGLLRYGALFKGTPRQELPSAFLRILDLSKPSTALSTRSHPITPPLSLSLEEKKEEPSIPLLSMQLLDLSTLKQLNEALLLKRKDEASPYSFLEFWERSSFWWPNKQKFQEHLIELVKKFNDCFTTKHASEESFIEKGNLCLQNLINYIQDSQTFYYLMEEKDEFYNRQYLLEFFLLYGQTLENELKTLDGTYKKLLQANSELQAQVESLEQQVQKVKSPNLEKIPMSLELYKEPLVRIVSVILFAEQLQDARLIPTLMTILRHSYSALIPFQAQPEEKEEPTVFHCAPLTQEKTLSSESPLSEDWPKESLEYLSLHSQILLTQYKKNLPPQSWSLPFNRSAEKPAYLEFCQSIKKPLEAFNAHFDENGLAEHKLEAANQDLRSLRKQSTEALKQADDLNWAFYQTCNYEQAELEAKTQPLPFLGWKHLKALNQALEKLVVEIKQWSELEYGHHTNVPLLIGLIDLFNSQFLNPTIRENEDREFTLKANKILLSLMHMLFWDVKEKLLPYKQLNYLMPFIIQYNRYIEQTLAPLQMRLHQKELYKELLQQNKEDLSTHSNLQEKNKELLRRYIQTILKAKTHAEPVYIKALKTLITQLETKPKQEEIEKNILQVAQKTLKDLNCKTSSDSLQASASDSNPGTKPLRLFPAEPWSFLLIKEPFLSRLKSSASSLLSELPSGHELTLPITQFLKQINGSGLEKEANKSLHQIIHGINQDLNLETSQGENRLDMQKFLIDYSRTLTEYLKQVREEDYKDFLLCKNLTKQIDALNQSQAFYSLSSKPLIKGLFYEERVKNKAEMAVKNLLALIFNVKDELVDLHMFNMVRHLLLSLNSVLFEDFEEEKPSSLSFKFC